MLFRILLPGQVGAGLLPERFERGQGSGEDAATAIDEYMAEYYKVGGKWDQEHGFADPD